LLWEECHQWREGGLGPQRVQRIGGNLELGRKNTLIDGFNKLAQNPCILKDLITGRVSVLNLSSLYLFVWRSLLSEIIIIKFLAFKVKIHFYRCSSDPCKDLMVFCALVSFTISKKN
jgi:hypothetical protein